MKHLFINPNTGIIRAAWRILIFVVLFLALNAALSVLVRTILGSLKGGGLLWFTLLGISATLAVFISRKYIDKESFVSLGLRFNRLAIKDLLVGVGLNALIMAAMYFTLQFSGLIQFDGFSWWKESADAAVGWTMASFLIMLRMVFQFFVVAWWEELAFRGVVLQNITKGIGLKWGIALSTLLFALVHAGNPDATFLSTFFIVIVTLQLVYAYLKSGQLWLPIGLHWGWNFFQASIFGFASSGHSSPSLIMQHPIGPDWLSGGEFGAEHSIFILPFTLVSFFVINWWSGRTRMKGDNFFFKFNIPNDSTVVAKASLNSEGTIDEKMISANLSD